MPTSARSVYDGIFGKRRGDVGIAPYEMNADNIPTPPLPTTQRKG